MPRKVLRLPIYTNGILKAITAALCQHPVLGGDKYHFDAAGISLYGAICQPIISVSLGTELVFPTCPDHAISVLM